MVEPAAGCCPYQTVLRQPEQLISDGVVVFNSILVACIAVAVFPSLSGHPIDATFWAILVVILIITAYIDRGLNAIMAPSKLPGFSIPFNLAAVLMLLSLRGSAGLTGSLTPPQPSLDLDLSLNTSSSENSTQEVDWLKVIEGSVLAAGQIYGVGTLDSSILIILGFLVCSPLLVLFYVIGSIIGSIIGVMASTAPYLEVYMGLWGYNALLTSGGLIYFLQPTFGAIFVSVIGAILAAMVQAASIHIFSPMAVPVLSYPFNVATLLLLAITNVEDAPLTQMPEKTFPEHHVFLFLTRNRRQRSVAGIEEQQEQEEPFPVIVK